MKITSQEEYGLRCLVQIARRGLEGDPAQPVPISEIARAEGLSVEYAGKLLSLLRQGGLVTSIRGKNGGYVLARPARDISLLQLVTALSGPVFEEDSCNRFSGVGAECVHLGDCGMRPVWWALSNLLGGLLDSITLEALCSSEHEVAGSLRQKLLEHIEGFPFDATSGRGAPGNGSSAAGVPLATPGLIPPSE